MGRSVFKIAVFRRLRISVFLAGLCLPLIAVAQGVLPAGYTPALVKLVSVPVDFILFGLTLLGVALFHAHTLRVALVGVVTISLYKITFTGFKFGPGVSG